MISLINQNLEQQATPWVACSYTRANYFGKKAKPDGSVSILNSVYVSGYVLTLQDNVLKPIKSNMGVSYALYDEGAFREMNYKATEAADMRIAPESLRTVNAVLDKV